MINGYNSDAITDIEQIATWQTASYISIGVSCAAGAFFIFELVKYLKSADAVIPATARQAKNSEIEKSLEKSKELKIEAAVKKADSVQSSTDVTSTDVTSSDTTSQDATSTEETVTKINE